jgi:hypothetical protein
MACFRKLLACCVHHQVLYDIPEGMHHAKRVFGLGANRAILRKAAIDTGIAWVVQFFRCCLARSWRVTASGTPMARFHASRDEPPEIAAALTILSRPSAVVHCTAQPSPAKPRSDAVGTQFT